MASLPDGFDINAILDPEDVDEIFTLEEEIASGSFGTVYKVCAHFALPLLPETTSLPE